MKLKSKSLYLLLPFVIIVNSTALYLWKELGWTKPTLIFTLLGIGTVLFFFLMNQFYEYLQGNRYFIIGGTILQSLSGLYLWIDSELPHVGISFVLMGGLEREVEKHLWRCYSCTRGGYLHLRRDSPRQDTHHRASSGGTARDCG